MKPTRECIEDLVVRGRRGELSTDEQRRLQIALETSQENRLLYEVGSGFDQESSVSPGDDELMARLAERVEAARRSRELRLPRRMPLLLAGGVLALTTAAAAGWVARQRLIGAEAPTFSGRHVTEATEQRAPESKRRASAALRPSAPDARPRLEGEPETQSSTSPRRPPAASPEPAGPNELFVKANRARRSGQTGRAMHLYQQLQSRHPGSAEAQHANLTLAELYLQNGSPTAALDHFRRYRGRALAAEALWGEARALRRLGRSAEERRGLQNLIERFPGSAYADAARKRLGKGPD
jgi:TolA-binding protein